MGRDDFFEGLARDHFPGPRAVYDGPDGTARRTPRPVSRRPAASARRTRRDAGRASGHRDNTRGRAWAGVCIAAILPCAVAVSLVGSGGSDPAREQTRSHPASSGTIASPARRLRPRRSAPARSRAASARPTHVRGEPAARKHPPARRPARGARRPTPAATPRLAAPAPIATAAPTAPRAPATNTPPPVASEPSCEFPPC